jgi:hypothetical protein
LVRWWYANARPDQILEGLAGIRLADTARHERACAGRTKQEEITVATRAKRTATKKRTTTNKSTRAKTRGAGKRDTVKAKNATLYAKRTARGRFKAMDEKGRSLKAEGRTKAKTKVTSGYGDRGDPAA